MSATSANVDKPIEIIHPDNLPHANEEHLSNTLTALVDHSAEHHDVSKGIHLSMHSLPHVPWIHELIPGIEKLAVDYHVGNYVLPRGSDKPFFESMPIYARFAFPQADDVVNLMYHFCTF